MAPSSAAGPAHRAGVGIDTSRYGHYAAFLHDDLQPAAAELSFAESAAGYAQLRQRLEHIAQRHSRVHFAIRLDAAGQYAENLLHFVHQLAAGGDKANRLANSDVTPLANVTCSISTGDPQRNKNYRAAVFGSHKSDPVEARAAARYAVSEQPAPVQVMPLQLRILRQVAGRLQAVVRQRTRLINQFHHLLALTFPELALLVKDMATGWVLEMVHRYPTAKRLAHAAAGDLENIPYLPHQHIDALLQHARTSIASLAEPAVEELVRDQVRQLRDVSARQKRLENLLVSRYQHLPQANHLDSISGIGAATAAALVAKVVDIDRFATPEQFVGYFGVFPEENSSGVDKHGNPLPPGTLRMSRKGNDLVRHYLWNAARAAIRHNPAVRALYHRLKAKGKRGDVAIGHCMRKLLHLVFAVWKSNRPFDALHYPWEKPSDTPMSTTQPAAPSSSSNDEAVGHKRDMPATEEVVTTAAVSVAPQPTPVNPPAPTPPAARPQIDFPFLRQQVTMEQVLGHLGFLDSLRGGATQKRGPCPVHG